MRFWTTHLRRDRPPVLIPEGFSFWAFLFGPIWLALHGAWVPAGLSLAAALLIGLLPDPMLGLVLEFALALLLGLSGHDLRRWTMHRRGYVLGTVLAAPTETDALARLLVYRPELKVHFAPAVSP